MELAVENASAGAIVFKSRFVLIEADYFEIVYSVSKAELAPILLISAYDIPSPIPLHSFTTGHIFDPISIFYLQF